MPLPAIIGAVGMGLRGIGALTSMFDTTDEDALREQQRNNRAQLSENRRQFGLSLAQRQAEERRTGGIQGLATLMTMRQEAADLGRKRAFRDALLTAGRGA